MPSWSELNPQSIDKRLNVMSYSDRIKALFQKYGRVGVAVHLTIYASTLAGCYIAAERNSKLEELLLRHGLLSDKELQDDADPSTRGWFAQSFTSSGSSFALAFLCTKALLPVRVPLTIAITPPIARYIFGYIFPAFSCFKVLEARKGSAIRDWCVYWLLLAIFTTAERLFLDWLVFWLPLYYEAKVIFVIWLWHPKSKGANWLYQAYLQPLLTVHGHLIDEKIAEAQSWTTKILRSHFSRLTSIVQSQAHVAIAALQNLQNSKIEEVDQKRPDTGSEHNRHLGDHEKRSRKQLQPKSRRRSSESHDSDSSLDLPSVPMSKID